VLIPKSRYKGQKFIKLVKTNIPATTKSTIPKVPLTVLVKYNKKATAAITKRIMRSVLLMFLFIWIEFGYYSKLVLFTKSKGDISRFIMNSIEA